MHSFVKALAVASLAASAAAAATEAQPYAQCGGSGYSGPTTCVSGWTCSKASEYYSQCVQGTASSAAAGTTKASSSATSSATVAAETVGDSSSSSSSTTCSTSFTSITAKEFVANMNPGWNLGNTLDAIPTEGSWNNPPVQASTFDQVKAAGFKSVRIPVTYTDHFTGTGPEWAVDSAWLDRVEAVVDMATERGLYVLTNVHHDSWAWADVSVAGANQTEIRERFYRLWYQIGTKLACKSQLVAFEALNEPPVSTATDGANLNKLNEVFLEAVQASGGHNTQRVVNLVGGKMDPLLTTEYFKAPANVKNPWALQVHYYSPYDFIFSAWGKTIWGSSSDQSSMASDLDIVRGNFSDVPIVIGEFDASPINTEAAARWRYTDYLTQVADSIGASLVIWDNGLDHLDRTTGTWRDPTSIHVLEDGVKGVKNALPDSTTDASASTQSSSAFVWHKAGEAVAAQTLPWLFNGKTLKSIASGSKQLASGSDYSVSSSGITFTKSFLASVFTDNTPGSKANLTLTFSAGAPVIVNAITWDTPVFSSTSSTAVSGSDLNIPVTFKGLGMVAAVQMLKADGSYLVDSWTSVLGPLQKGCGTYSSQYDWTSNSVKIMSAAVSDVISGGQATTFKFEFYPRVAGNSVTYTLKP